MAVDPISLIDRLYKSSPHAHDILLHHSNMVADKAVKIARRLTHFTPDIEFVKEAAMLHDIGIGMTHSPTIGCNGSYPYICHGILGRDILDNEGLPKHALVCERHVGVGISKTDIENQRLPLPLRDMLPVSIEEQIICFADKFFSKNNSSLQSEKKPDQIIKSLEQYGGKQADRFRRWLNLFGDM